MQHPAHDAAHEPSALLLAAAGLSMDAADLAGVRALRARFAADRQRLAAIDLRDAEPLTVVVPPRVEGA
jgi:hypothetical protein